MRKNWRHNAVRLEDEKQREAQPALDYTRMSRLREIALTNTELAKACAATSRVKLLKFAAAVVRNTRRVRILLASHHLRPLVFKSAAQALAL